MLGLYTLISSKQVKKLADFIYFIDDGIVKSAYSIQSKSPIKYFKSENWNILIEGAIYNFNQLEIEEYIVGILESNAQKSNIEAFQDIADGEFIIQMINLKEQIGLIIPDKYARLPFYYTPNDDIIILSRNINTILNDIPEIKLNYQAFYEYSTFEYMLGNKTYFKDIFRLEPLEYLEISFKDILKVYPIKRENESFDLKVQKKPLLEKYYQQFISAVKNRVEFCKKENLEISSALSGGFDSRAIFGALNKQNVDANHFTYEYIQDESEIAKILYYTNVKIGRYEKFSFANTFDLNDSIPIVFNCQGLANPFTCVICTKDSEFQATNQKRTSTVWGGLGGEFIRHPYKYGQKDIFTSLAQGYIPRDLFANEGLIKNYDGDEFREKLKEHLQNYKEKTLEGQLKHFYLEYYLHRVGNGEDLWGRRNFWTIHPMMGLTLIDFFKDMPLKFASFNTFRKFLKRIDPKLITVPIYKDNYNLKSIFYFKRDIDNLISFRLKQINLGLRIYLYFLLPLYRKWFKPSSKNANKFDFELEKKVFELFEKSKLLNRIFNRSQVIEGLNSNMITNRSNLISLLFYLRRIEELYGEKIVLEE